MPESTWIPLACNIGVAIFTIILNNRIKRKIDKQNESLKSKLSLKTQYKLTVKKYELDAILNYDKILSRWLLNLFKWNPYKYNIWTYKKIRPTQSSIKSYKSEIRYNDTNLEILISDTSYLTLINSLILKAEEYEVLLETIIDKVIGTLYEYDADYHGGLVDIYDEEDDEKFNAAIKQSINKISDFHKNQFERLRNQTKDLYNLYKRTSNILLTKIEEDIDVI